MIDLTTTPASPPYGIVYIAGYGQSGSTILDIALSAHPRVEGFGELELLHEILEHDAYSLDSFWDDFAAGQPLPPVAAARIIARAERLSSLSVLRPRAAFHDDYLDIQRATFDELAARSGADVLVDSSKSTRTSTWRLPLLAQVDPGIHCLVLVRDLEGVIRSVRRGRGDTGGRHRLPTTRALIGWTLSNVTAVATGLRTCGPSRVRLVRYENFAADPQSMLESIFDWMGLERSVAIADGVEHGFRPAHQVAGNRVRNKPVIKIDPRVGQATPLPGRTGSLIRRWAALIDSMVLRRVTELSPGDATSPAAEAATAAVGAS